jgi:hypothetical protein
VGLAEYATSYMKPTVFETNYSSAQAAN